MRTRLLTLEGAKDFHICQAEFDSMFPAYATTDVLGNKVIFNSDACEHICFKPEDRRRNIGPRIEWEQKRAERILWIKDALTTPKCIRFAPGNAWAYMLQVSEDRENNLPPELYVAIAQPTEATPETRGTLQFKTAYPITIQKWDEYKKTRPWIYPDFGQERPIKERKKSKE